jgi:hypothetical protein
MTRSETVTAIFMADALARSMTDASQCHRSFGYFLTAASPQFHIAKLAVAEKSNTRETDHNIAIYFFGSAMSSRSSRFASARKANSA